MPQADVAVRNKANQVAFMVATKAGHDNIKEILQPVRQNLQTQMKEINTDEQFHEARSFVRTYGLHRLKHEMGAPPHRNIRTSPLVGTSARDPPYSPPHTLPVAAGFVDKSTYTLTTGVSPFNVFARVGAGVMAAHKEDNEALERAGEAVSKDYSARFKVARNLLACDTNWADGSTEWLGKASMSARHRSDECVSNTRAQM